MVKLLDDAEKELRKLVPKHDHKKVQSDLKINKEMRDDIKRATDDMMGKMRELSETLASVASQEQQVNKLSGFFLIAVFSCSYLVRKGEEIYRAPCRGAK